MAKIEEEWVEDWRTGWVCVKAPWLCLPPSSLGWCIWNLVSVYSRGRGSCLIPWRTGSSCWGTLTLFAFSLEVYPLDATTDFSLSSCFVAIHFSIRVPSPLGQLQANFVCRTHTALGKQLLCPFSTIHPLHSHYDTSALLPIRLIQPLGLCKLPEGRDWLQGKLGLAVVKAGSCSVKLL